MKADRKYVKDLLEKQVAHSAMHKSANRDCWREARLNDQLRKALKRTAGDAASK